jgi:hypothetical protein
MYTKALLNIRLMLVFSFLMEDLIGFCHFLRFIGA